ncbi:hypothetical protein FRC01_003680 [Tulasnella sp. 417]|nr:hypothetical protein FRC01_003680 [Tulasnella sp. 417]
MGDHTFPSPPQSSFTPVANIAATWASVSGSSARDSSKELLNCLRVLGRIIPILYESEGSLEEEIMWRRKRKEASPHDPMSEEQEPQFVIQEEEDSDDDEDEDEDGEGEDEDDEDGDDNPAEAATPTRPTVAISEEELEPALADKLLSTAIDLMFCCGFTIPSKFKVDSNKINYTIWEKGIGSTVEVHSSGHLDANKVEVLRFLEILLSKTIYMTPSHLLLLTNPYISRLVHNHQTPRRLVLPILCSLLNTAMNSGSTKVAAILAPSVGGVINGVGDMVKELPYNHLMWKEDSRPHLVSASLGVLVALLDYQSAEGRDPPVSGGTAPPATTAPNAPGGPIDVAVAPTAVTNSFRYFLAKLHRPADLDYILNGILGILEQHMTATHNVLPGSRKGVPYVLETFLFFWKMVELNKKFRTHLTESDKLVDILVYLLLFCLEHKDKPQHHGLCRALSYIIQTLSSEPAFGTKMTLPVPSRIVIPAKWATPGSTADFFISSVYYTVATTSGQLNFTYPALLIALANAAPHMQYLQVPSATRLVQLFTSFSNPNFLLADDGHPRLVFLLLEIFNQIIYHQFQENPNLIYAILRSHKRFESLGTFTLARGLREIQRIKEAKEEAERIKTGRPLEKGKALDVGSPTSTPASNDSPSSRFTNLEDSSVDKLSLSRASSEAASSQLHDDAERPIPVPPTPSVGSTERQFATMRVSSPPASVQGLSEKARGKMREQAPGQPDEGELTPELLSVAAAGVGRNGFVPSQEWVTSWQQGLPLDTVLLLISELLPKVHELQNSSKTSNNIGHIIDFLRGADIRSSLPTPPPIAPRRFQWSDASLVWLSSMIWGEIFVKGTTSLAIWNATNVRLFGVRHTPQQRGVSNFVGGLLGNTSPTPNSPPNPGSGGHSRRVSRAI